MKNHYENLGVSTTSSLLEIKSAYRSLVLKYHPDRNKNNPKAIDFFRQIQEAYDVLSDTSSRARYDQVISRVSAPIYRKKHTQQSIIYPKVDLFIVDKKAIYIDEEVTFYWKCSSADIAYLNPIGTVPIRGKKTVRFTKSEKKELDVILTAYNSLSKTKSYQKITLQILGERTFKETIVDYTTKIVHDFILHPYRYILWFLFFCLMQLILFTDIASNDKKKSGTPIEEGMLDVSCGREHYFIKYNLENNNAEMILDQFYRICEQEVSDREKDSLIMDYLQQR